MLENHLKTRELRQKELKKLKTASKQDINEQTFIFSKKVQNRAQKEAKHTEKLKRKEESQRGEAYQERRSEHRESRSEGFRV